MVDRIGEVTLSKRVAAWPDRRFVVFEFWVEHGQLVLRSSVDGGGEIIDCFFSGVDQMKLFMCMTALEVYEGSAPCELYQGVHVYILVADEMVGWIVSSAMSVRQPKDATSRLVR